MPRSHFLGFGLKKMDWPKRREETRVFWRFAAFFGLLAALAPATARAQTNLDAGKTAVQMFDSDCAVCHKATRGLAAGKSGSALTDFLTEHYTSSRQQAASLAAYVLGAGGGLAAAPAQEHGQKPAERARASAEEPKPNRRERHAERSEPETPTTRLRNDQEPHRRTTGERQKEPGAVARRHRNEPEASPSVPLEPAVNAAPGAGETPDQAVSSQESGPGQNTPVPADAQPSASAPVPRDKIPD